MRNEKSIKKKKLLMMAIICLAFIISMTIIYKSNIIPISNEKTYENDVNNNQSSNLGEIKKSTNVTQTFETSNSFSGVGVRFATYANVNKGNIKAKLINLDNNEEIQEWDVATEDLKDNSYYNFKLDEIEYNSTETNYELVLDISMLDEKSFITITTSDDNVYLDGDFYLNGEYRNDDICIVTYSENTYFIRTMFLIMSIVLLIFISSLYYMIFIKKSKIENIFLISALVIGIMYAFIQTPYSNYDEPAHVDTVYRMSNKMLGIDDTKATDGKIFKRAEDTQDGLSSAATTITTYKTVYDRLLKSAENPELVEMNATNVREVSYVYLPGTLAISFGRLMNMGQIQLIMFGRILNLLFFIGAVYFSIKKIPFAKMIVFSIAMLPMTLHQAASFSYDGPIIGIALLYI